MWRLSHNSLPWKNNFKRRGMEIDTICPMCNRLDEDGGHIFLHCKQVKLLWRMLNLEEEREKLCLCLNAKDMLMDIFQVEEQKRLLIIALLWQWWTTRNKKNVGDGIRSVQEVAFQSRRWALEFSHFYLKKHETKS
jgi:hypothetical protein